MMDEHYETKGVKSWRRLVYNYYPTLVYFRPFENLDVNIFNVINPMLGQFKNGKWHYRSRDAYDLVTMMFHIMTDKDRKLFDFYTTEIAEGRDYDKFIPGLCRSQPWYAYKVYCYNHTLIPFEKCYSRITCSIGEDDALIGEDEEKEKAHKFTVVGDDDADEGLNVTYDASLSPAQHNKILQRRLGDLGNDDEPLPKRAKLVDV
jgi:hypothetical protein